MDQICRHLMGYRAGFKYRGWSFQSAGAHVVMCLLSLSSTACKALHCVNLYLAPYLNPALVFRTQPTAIQTQAKHFAFLHTHTIHSTPLYNALSIILFHFSPRYLLISSKNITSRTLLNFITNKSEQKSKDKTDKHQIITMFHVNTLLACLPSLSSRRQFRGLMTKVNTSLGRSWVRRGCLCWFCHHRQSLWPMLVKDGTKQRWHPHATGCCSHAQSAL